MCAWAKKRVPAYTQFLADSGHVFRIFELARFPRRARRATCSATGSPRAAATGGSPSPALGRRSAGSSGKAYNWLRSAKELGDVHLNTSNWVRYTYPTERLFAINAFSMGAVGDRDELGIALSRRAW